MLNTGYLNTKRLGIIERMVDGLESVCSRTIESPARVPQRPRKSSARVSAQHIRKEIRIDTPGIPSSGPIVRLNFPIFFFHFESRRAVSFSNWPTPPGFISVKFDKIHESEELIDQSSRYLLLFQSID